MIQTAYCPSRVIRGLLFFALEHSLMMKTYTAPQIDVIKPQTEMLLVAASVNNKYDGSNIDLAPINIDVLEDED